MRESAWAYGLVLLREIPFHQFDWSKIIVNIYNGCKCILVILKNFNHGTILSAVLASHRLRRCKWWAHTPVAEYRDKGHMYCLYKCEFSGVGKCLC